MTELRHRVLAVGAGVTGSSARGGCDELRQRVVRVVPIPELRVGPPERAEAAERLGEPADREACEGLRVLVARLGATLRLGPAAPLLELIVPRVVLGVLRLVLGVLRLVLGVLR